MRDDRERLFDILEAIERIDKYTARGRSAFDTILKVVAALGLKLHAAPS